jgi:hypothetical protein
MQEAEARRLEVEEQKRKKAAEMGERPKEQQVEPPA